MKPRHVNFLLLSACALVWSGCQSPPEATPPSRASAVLEQQYAAATPVPPMSAVEGEVIYQQYISNIGVKIKGEDDETEANSK